MTAITSWLVDDWPFTMAKFLDYYTLLFKSDGTNVDVYEVYCATTGAWDATKIIENVHALQNPGTGYMSDISIADFGTFYALSYSMYDSAAFSAECFTRDPSIASGTGALSALPSDACPDFMSCCNFNGQAILGGIISTDANWTQLGHASVAWGAIGQWEFRPSQNKTAGYIKMPWSDWDMGVVFKVAKLGKAVMVYGNGGRALIYPYTKELATGFGLKELVGPGLTKGFHMAGDSTIHGYIDVNNEFWVVDENFNFQKLGYKEYIDTLQDENDAIAADSPIIVSFDRAKKRFYLSGQSSAYVLTEFGMYSSHQSVTGIGRHRGKSLIGFYKDLEDYEARGIVDTIDFKVRALKIIDLLEFGMDYETSDGLHAGVDFKYDYDESYRTGNWIRLTPQGVCTPLIAANDFRIKFKATDYRTSNVKVDFINARYKMVDKRGIRGPYAGETIK
jgi:hypothetical protein